MNRIIRNSHSFLLLSSILLFGFISCTEEKMTYTPLESFDVKDGDNNINDTLKLVVGKNFSVNFSYHPEEANITRYQIVSENENIAKGSVMDNGECFVTGLTNGITTLEFIVSFLESNGVESSMSKKLPVLVILDYDDIAGTSLTFNNKIIDSLYLKVGESGRIGFELRQFPKAHVVDSSFISDDTKVVSISSDNIITANGSGETEVIGEIQYIVDPQKGDIAFFHIDLRDELVLKI